MKNFILGSLVLLAAFPILTSAVQLDTHPHNIVVTAPVDGGVWPIGVTQTVRWEAPAGVDNVDITLMHFDCNDDLSDCDQVQSIILGDDVPNDGMFDIQLRPGYATSSRDKYKVEVRNHSYRGESEGYITITNPNNISMGRDITVLTPNTNADVWAVGESKLIKWRTAVPGGVVKISLRDTRTGSEKNIVVNAPNTGKFTYTLPARLANLGDLGGQNYKIVVYHLRLGDTVSDASDGTFTINPAI